MFDIGFKLLLTYLLGSVLGALVVGRLCGVDIRTQGSGNAGGTNALRTQGWWFALGVVLIDVGKGVIATSLVARVHWPVTPGAMPSADLVWLCALAVTVGHIYPLWWEFRGGKGAATLIGALLGAAPALLPPLLLLWLLVVMASGFVGLGTMLAVLALVPLSAVSDQAPADTTAFAVVAAALVIWAHRSNIARMWHGTEPRARRLWWRSYLGSQPR